jgi:hypothetical protein
MVVVLGLITSFSNNSCNCFFDAFEYSMHYLYSCMFGKVESDSNYISCSTSLLGGMPFRSYNASLFVCKDLPMVTFIFSYILPRTPLHQVSWYLYSYV